MLSHPLVLTITVFLLYGGAQIIQLCQVEAFLVVMMSDRKSVPRNNVAAAAPAAYTPPRLLLLLGQNDDDNDDGVSDSGQNQQQHQQQQQTTQQQHPYRSVSDYMGGHHAGKFDFDTTIYGVTSLNYEKSLVFDDVASNLKESSASMLKIAPIHDGDELDTSSQSNLPKWATRPMKIPSSQDVRSAKSIMLGRGGHHQSVVITNDERSWEPFYASIECFPSPSSSGPSILLAPSVRILDDNNGSRHLSTLRVLPACGKLAPRGGSPPYSDSCKFDITLSSEEEDASSSTTIYPSLSSPTSSSSPLYLVVRTECDSWIWPIEFVPY